MVSLVKFLLSNLTTFKYDTSEDMGKLFDLEASGYFYTRLQNPTNDHVAAKIAALEGGTAANAYIIWIRLLNFFALLIYVNVAVISLHHHQYMVELSILFQLLSRKWE